MSDVRGFEARVAPAGHPWLEAARLPTVLLSSGRLPIVTGWGTVVDVTSDGSKLGTMMFLRSTGTPEGPQNVTALCPSGCGVTPTVTGRRRKWHHTALLAALLVACERAPATPPVVEEDLPPRTDTLAPRFAPLPPPPAWRMAEAGRLLAVMGTTPRTARLVLPEYADESISELGWWDVGVLVPLRVELFARQGRVGDGSLVGAQRRGAEGCPAWPSAELRSPSGEPTAPWTVGFAAGRASAVPMDSIETLAAPDSAVRAAEVARLASGAPNDSAGAFRGVPYVVRTAREFQVDENVRGLVALVVRRMAIEANPLQEHLFMIAESPADTPRAVWRLAYSERVVGPEETVESVEVLAGVRLGRAGRLSLVLGRDHGDGVTYSLVERAGAGRWLLRWSSAYVASEC